VNPESTDTAPIRTHRPVSQRRAPLRTVSLRRRVTALSLTVLAVVLLVVVVLTDVLFAAQSRTDARAQLAVRANLAGQLVTQGVAPRLVTRRIEMSGLAALLVTPDGRRFGTLADEPAPSPGGTDQVLRRTLSDGSQLTLVADGQVASLAQQRLRRTLILLGLGALAVAGGVMLLATRLALAPLDAMTALARSITRGDRGARLAPPRTDTELGRAAAAFDDMLDALEGAEAGARDAAERTRRFVADAAHELRTPLAGVQAVAEAAMAPELSAEERERLNLLLLRETRRAARLVDDLLVLARLDAGLPLRREPVDLLELARAEADRVRLLTPDRALDVDGAPGLVAGDGQRLGQVLGNLLDNASRHTPPGGRVTVRVWSGGMTVVQVTDTGPGVPRADRERIFDRLVRLDDARARDGGGSGLGLAIARGIARAHGGDLRCVEPPGGHGAAFVLTLPAGPPLPADQSSSASVALRM
jgi:two-component system OmpR family sensor kinase